MSARDREFVIAEIMQVSRGAAVRDFPEFPRAGTLVTLSPPVEVAKGELSGYSAQVTARGAQLVLDYSFWQVNERNVIGLLCRKLDESAIPLGSSVRFIRRRRRQE